MKGLEASANRNNLNKLEIDMTKEEVRELYKAKEVWFYITEWQADGYTTADEMTPLVFEDKKLIGWGSSFIEEDIKKYELRVR